MDKAAEAKEIKEDMSTLRTLGTNFEGRVNSYIKTNNIEDLVNAHICLEQIKDLLEDVWSKINKHG